MLQGRLFTAMLLSYALVAAVVLAACSRPAFGNPPQSHGGPVRDHVSFVDSLRAAGYMVDPAADLQRPFLRAKGTLLRLSGGDLAAAAEVESYNYDDRDLGTNGAAAAQADAAQIQPDGQPKTGSVAWSAAPHFFLKERVLVLYLGSDPTVLNRLTDLLGPQFAGQ
jgi:hypothetical protein